MNDSLWQQEDLPLSAPLLTTEAPEPSIATPVPLDPADQTDLPDPADTADQAPEQEEELAEEEDALEEEEEEEADYGPTAQDLRDDIAASAAETRRSTRRTMEVLKEFGTALGSMSLMLKDVHTTARATAAASSQPASDDLPKDWALALIDLHDRISRQAGAFQKSPGPTAAWWPGSKAALAPWAEAWSTQQAAVSILQGHLETLLTRAQLQRIPTAGLRFDPSTMSAVEARPDSSVPDHSVLTELLPGWRNQATNQILRPAQVCVARS
jgi:molecular chaperone GrpE (heat shock protein)